MKVSEESSFSSAKVLSQYHRGLWQSIRGALADVDGHAVLQLTNLIRECQTNAANLSSVRSSIGRAKEFENQRRLSSAVLEMEAFSSRCQTVYKGLTKSRHQLLEFAYSRGVVGASGRLWLDVIRTDGTLKGVNRDAGLGDLNSLAKLAYEKSSQSGIIAAEQYIYRVALVELAADPVHSSQAAGYLDLATRMYTSDVLSAGGREVPSYAVSNAGLM